MKKDGWVRKILMPLLRIIHTSWIMVRNFEVKEWWGVLGCSTVKMSMQMLPRLLRYVMKQFVWIQMSEL